MTRKAKWASGIGGAIIIVLMSVLYLVLDSTLNMLVKPDFTTARDYDAYLGLLKEYAPTEYEWTDSLIKADVLKDTFIVANDGRKLHALYAKAEKETPKTAFIVHGWTDNAIMALEYAYLFYNKLGYNIFMPDLNAHGKSDGEVAQMGWFDRIDVLNWMPISNNIFASTNTLTHAKKDTEMVLMGISMGAATTMCVSGEQTPPYLKAFIEDCGYTDVWGVVESNPACEGALRHFIPLVSKLCKLKYGWDFREASPLKQVAKCQLPMLFIHGENDDFVPTAMVHPLYEAKNGAKELWIAPKSRHATSYRDHREEYTAKVGSFLEKYMP